MPASPRLRTRQIEFLEPDQVRARNPAVRGETLGALSLQPRTRWSNPGSYSAPSGTYLATTAEERYRFHAGRRVVATESPGTGGLRRGPAGRLTFAVVATGAAFDDLPAARGVAARLRRVRLQMFETAPHPVTLTTSLADADSLRYYPAYESAPLAELGAAAARSRPSTICSSSWCSVPTAG